MTIRVIIADDQRLVRAGFRKILEAEDDITVLAEASNGLEAIAAARRHQSDVVLMDIRMPDLDGLEATRQLLRDDPALTRVLILTTFDLDEYVYQAPARRSERLPAQGLPARPADRRHQNRRRRRCAAGALHHAQGDPGIRPAAGPVSASPPTGVSDLTAREHEVLTLLAKGLSNSQIADQLIISDATVKTHVARVLMKLNLADRVHAVIFAYETGLVQPGET